MRLDSGYDIGAECPYYSTIQSRLDPIPLERLDTGLYKHEHLKYLFSAEGHLRWIWFNE